jgi:hypothetical protein
MSADDSVDVDEAYRTTSGYGDNILHADRDCQGLEKADVMPVDPQVYLPTWDWCKACTDVQDPAESDDQGDEQSESRLSSLLERADSLDELREEGREVA